jgi:hypothetical protein
MAIPSLDIVKDFKEAAEKFCLLLESQPVDTDAWGEELVATLAQVYAFAHRLPNLESSDNCSEVPDSIDVTREEWRHVFDLVHDLLGPQSVYLAYFDPSEPSDSTANHLHGDLADDLVDIYRDLKPGLRAWASGNDAMIPSIVFDWKFPLFGSHWGIHAVSAMRALHPIVFLRGIEKHKAS